MTKKAWILTAAAMGVTVVLEIAFRHLGHPEYVWHSIPAFDLVYGFLSCAVIVIVSKWIGHTFLQRDEDYYERKDS